MSTGWQLAPSREIRYAQSVKQIPPVRKKLDELISASTKPVALFDLDGTLFDVNHRHLEILRRFADQDSIREEYAEFIVKMDRLKIKDFHYSIEATLNGLGIDRYSERAAHFIQLADKFWFKHFFTDELLASDRPFPGAVECVKHFRAAGAHIVYLSGRDVPNMSRGTLAALESHGFPHSGHGVSLILKPAYGMNDLLFKEQALETVKSEGEVVATFDNEPANVQLFLRAFPRALNFHFDSLYAKKLELAGDGLRVIKSFTELGF